MQAVTRITGPHHHFLGIQFSPCPTTALPVLERVSCDSIEAEIGAFDSHNTLWREVVDGVSEANDRLGTHYAVSKIRYCADDLLIPGVYRQLAQVLVEHVAQESEGSAGELSKAKFQEILKQLASIEIDRLGSQLSELNDRSFEAKASAALEKAKKFVFPRAVEELLAEFGASATIQNESGSRGRAAQVGKEGEWLGIGLGPGATDDPQPLMNESRRAINVDK